MDLAKLFQLFYKESQPLHFRACTLPSARGSLVFLVRRLGELSYDVCQRLDMRGEVPKSLYSSSPDVYSDLVYFVQDLTNQVAVVNGNLLAMFDCLHLPFKREDFVPRLLEVRTKPLYEHDVFTELCMFHDLLIVVAQRVIKLLNFFEANPGYAVPGPVPATYSNDIAGIISYMKDEEKFLDWLLPIMLEYKSLVNRNFEEVVCQKK